MVRMTVFRFLVVGAGNTLIGLAVISVAQALFDAGNVTANIAGYAVGLTVSFLLNKRWTFSFHGQAGASFLRFILVFALSYAANLFTVLALARVWLLPSLWCQTIGVLPYSTLFYLGCRYWVFPRNRASPAPLTSPTR